MTTKDSTQEEVVALLAASSHASPHRCGFRLRVKPEKLTEYIGAHVKVWDSMLEALQRQGWRDYSLFLDPATGEVFGYFESDDCSASIEGMSTEPADAQWQEFMSEFFVSPAGGEMAILPQYFYLQ